MSTDYRTTPRRPTVQTAGARNRFVAALADAVIVAYAAPGGKIERLCHDLLTWGKSLYTLEHKANAHLIELGARPLRPGMIKTWWGNANPN